MSSVDVFFLDLDREDGIWLRGLRSAATEAYLGAVSEESIRPGLLCSLEFRGTEFRSAVFRLFRGISKASLSPITISARSWMPIRLPVSGVSSPRETSPLSRWMEVFDAL